MKKDIFSRKLLSIIAGASSAILFYLLFGMVTSIIQNRFFTRMTPVGWLEYLSLATTSVLVGIYIGLSYYSKATNKDKVCNASAAAGGVFGFLTFGCSVCNKILIFFLGIAGVMAYFEPLRPILGILSIGLLGFAVFTKAKRLQKTLVT